MIEETRRYPHKLNLLPVGIRALLEYLGPYNFTSCVVL